MYTRKLKEMGEWGSFKGAVHLNYQTFQEILANLNFKRRGKFGGARRISMGVKAKFCAWGSVYFGRETRPIVAFPDVLLPETTNAGVHAIRGIGYFLSSLAARIWVRLSRSDMGT